MENEKKYQFKTEILTEDIYNATEGDQKVKMKIGINLIINSLVGDKITFNELMKRPALEFKAMMEAFDEQHGEMAEAFLG